MRVTWGRPRGWERAKAVEIGGDPGLSVARSVPIGSLAGGKDRA